MSAFGLLDYGLEFILLVDGGGVFLVFFGSEDGVTVVYSVLGAGAGETLGEIGPFTILKILRMIYSSCYVYFIQCHLLFYDVYSRW